MYEYTETSSVPEAVFLCHAAQAFRRAEERDGVKLSSPMVKKRIGPTRGGRPVEVYVATAMEV